MQEIEKLKLHDDEPAAGADNEKEEGEISAEAGPGPAASEADKPLESGDAAGEGEDGLLGDFEVYNAKKSFFDNLSSDVTDRIKLAERGERGPRIDRREERRKDADTFGDDAYRQGRGGYRGRGRGGYHSNSRGGGGYHHYDGQRGGYRGGYCMRRPAVLLNAALFRTLGLV
jgi:hypothetical protein